ncbi:hypothetical protein BN946_scf184782.g12 [Trametes cinnabarina]|uniref:Autophagy-related protein 3 n=1 Tax=Pycnoporus cinnabarinus TaxID=5643 RepID=A0A060S9L1_PYCCI|nr:hypothetical protein BN946_scf184782.g12 [Trametes cinnabarina]
MTLGPPPSAAGPSGGTLPATGAQNADNSTQKLPSSSGTPQSVPSAPSPSVSTGPFTSQFSVQPQPASRSYYARSSTNAYSTAYASNAVQSIPQQTPPQATSAGHYPHAGFYAQHPQPQGAQHAQAGTYSYYNYPSNAWSNAWNANAYQYGAQGSYTYPYAQAQLAPQRTASQPNPPAPAPTQETKADPAPPPKRKTSTPTPTPIPSPPPSPPPEYHKDWDAVIQSFLTAIGFTQAVRGFEADMLILNPDHERKKVPSALGDLLKDLLRLGQSKDDKQELKVQERPLEARKLDYVHVADGLKPRTPTSITKDISRFLARNRARNDASNRNEFLLSLAEKRRRLNESGDSVPSEPIPSCARTDAKTQNRDLQMKYDIAKNEDGPLRRTLKSAQPAAQEAASSADKTVQAGNAISAEAAPTAGRYPALDDRLKKIEKHLAIRYVPSPPRSLLDRLKFIEDHIVHLEKEYPPWAALHFNQPNRGWPPPPRPTPIIVPPHLRSTSEKETTQTGAPSTYAPSTAGQTVGLTTSESADTSAKGKLKAGRNTKSSLLRAVMERLEQQFWAVREYLSPVLKDSKFKEHGRITPEEFVAAGDFLAYKFPVWSWEKGDPSKARDYLPADKQYLVTRGVPCLRRATALAYTDADEDAERLLSFGDLSSTGNEADEWVETHAGRSATQDTAAHAGEIDDIPDVEDGDNDVAGAMGGLSLGGQGASEIPDMDEIPDMEEEDLEGGDEATAAPKTTAAPPSGVVTADVVEVAKGNLLQVRTYDVMITYDKYYQTPRIWLVGYDENGTPLTPAQIFQDVSADHAFKTVTIEAFPHSATLQAASVHPCKHASVMKKVIERMNQSIEDQQAARKSGGGVPSKDSSKQKKWLFRRASGNGKDDKATAAAAGGEEEVEGMRVDFYLVVFLKFIASIVPTIEVDSTASF